MSVLQENDVINYNWGLKELHSVLLEMLIDIDNFCKNNEIPYSLAYGTVLGAVRHHGFIPWDDDVDIYMPVDSYKVFREKINENGNPISSKYYLQELDAIDGMVELPKIRMNHTTFIEDCYSDKKMHHGIYIDIFILHNGTNKKISQGFQYLSNQYLLLKSLCNKKYKKKYNFILKVLRLFPYNFLREKNLRAIYKYDDRSSTIFFDTDIRSCNKSFYNKSMIFPTILQEFEGIMLPIPNAYDSYLHKLYGDYMRIPDFQQIKNSQHAKIWDVNKDYSDYLPFVIDFSDEHKGDRL